MDMLAITLLLTEEDRDLLITSINHHIDSLQSDEDSIDTARLVSILNQVQPKSLIGRKYRPCDGSYCRNIHTGMSSSPIPYNSTDIPTKHYTIVSNPYIESTHVENEFHHYHGMGRLKTFINIQYEDSGEVLRVLYRPSWVVEDK